MTLNAWLIPALPLAVSVLILGLGKSQHKAAAILAVTGQISALVLALVAFAPSVSSPGYRAIHNFDWFNFGDQTLALGWVLDPLSLAMLLMITFVGSCIFVFSVGYMAGDKDFTRFFAYLSFFSAAMLGLVLANSLLLLFICWELVGLASYLLIGFWIHKPSAAAAAKKAFITTRIGDLGFLLGLVWLYGRSGTVLFFDGGKGCLENAALVAVGGTTTTIALLIFCGAVGKSGQFPLHVWLPDAMEGPTPVSALIHAATMVAAGVFLVARVYPLFAIGALGGTTASLTTVVWIGVTTALLGAVVAIAQWDIKRILAYSTVSQLGLMMVSLGVGGVAAGMLHLLAHGFFKALLFLGAGSVIHGCHGRQDIREMGGLRRIMPVTFATYAIGMMALSGVPLFFSGAWTKEEILEATSHWPKSPMPYYLMLLGVILTAFYMTRQVIYVFFGNQRRASESAHESPPVMRYPLIVLGICTMGSTVVLSTAWPWLHDYLIGRSPEFDIGRVLSPALFLSLVLVAVGMGFGYFVYRNVKETDPLQLAQPALFRILENKFWFDELYNRTVIALSRAAAMVADFLDRYFWDGLVRLGAAIGQLFGIVTNGFDERGINAGVDDGVAGAQGLGHFISARHSGRTQTYLGAVALGMLALFILYAWLG